MSKKQLTSIERKMHYLESQIDEVNKALDVEWQEHIKKTKQKVL